MNIPLTEIIETKRCRLRIVSEEDIPYIWSATRYEGFNDGMTWDAPEKIEELEGPLKKNIESWKKGTNYSFTIEDKENADFLGRIAIRKGKDDIKWSIGFWIHPKYYRKGYAKEAAMEIVKFGFERLDADIIESCCATWNIASKKIFESVGMKFIKENKCGFKKKGKCVPEFDYEIKKEDWMKLNI